MQIGIAIAGDPWRFFNDIYEELASHYTVSVFKYRRWNAPIFNKRINRYIFRRELENYLSKHDVVFFEWASDLLVAATQLSKQTRIVTRLHRYEMFKWVEQINWENVDRIILVSRSMQSKFAQKFPAHAHKTVVIPVGVSTEKFQPVQKSFQGDIGTLCYPSPRKRVYELILAYAELIEKRPGFKLHIGGAGNKHPDYNDAIHDLVKKLELGEQVIFYGEVREAWNWYQNIDIFISNSYSEGLQVAPMEAMASGRYCLSHHWGGAEELLPAENLFLTNRELEEKIFSYSDLPEAEKQRLQERMRSIACENFDNELVKNQIRKVVEEVAQEPLSKEAVRAGIGSSS